MIETPEPFDDSQESIAEYMTNSWSDKQMKLTEESPGWMSMLSNMKRCTSGLTRMLTIPCAINEM